MSSSAPPAPPAPARKPRFPWVLLAGFAVGCGLGLFGLMMLGGPTSTADKKKAPEKADAKKADEKKEEPRAEDRKRVAAPEFEPGLAWLNTAGPLSLKKDLKGKVVLLDFWTLCCINCIHILPDLAKLEKKYANELVVIGVHSAKFENEKETRSIRKAVLRYEIAHPVVNDANHAIWDRYRISSWPSFALIDPEGKYLGQASGEGQFELLDKVIGKLVRDAKAKGTLNEKPIRFDLVRYRETGDTP